MYTESRYTTHDSQGQSIYVDDGGGAAAAAEQEPCEGKQAPAGARLATGGDMPCFMPPPLPPWFVSLFCTEERQ
jgi:hypothetical protein